MSLTDVSKKIDLPDDVRSILHTLTMRGHEAYAVGGCVRDSIMGKTPGDYDITTSAKPEEVKAIFPHTVDTGLKHGTVTVLFHHVGYEVTTYRIDGEYADGRHPDSVTFTGNLSDDLSRRDFTINAMAYNEADGLVDLYGGLADLEKGIIRCVGEPSKRFSEDALRMMRAVRFAAQLDFQIDDATDDAISALAPTLSRVSAERIRVELMKLLLSEHPERLLHLYETGLTAVFLPEFDVMMETPQNTPHHDRNVGEHTVAVVCLVLREPVLRLAALFHDIAKPECRTTDADGIDHFYGHPEAGDLLTGTIMRRLKFDNDTIAAVRRLVRWHDERPALTIRSVRKMVSKIGTDAFPDLFMLKRADTLGQSFYQREEKLHAIDEFERLYNEILAANDALTIKDLAVTGTDVINAGVPAGPEVGEVLKRLLEFVLDEPANNRREILLDEMKRYEM